MNAAQAPRHYHPLVSPPPSLLEMLGYQHPNAPIPAPSYVPLHLASHPLPSPRLLELSPIGAPRIALPATPSLPDLLFPPGVHSPELAPNPSIPDLIRALYDDPTIKVGLQLIEMGTPISELLKILGDDRDGWSFSNLYTFVGASIATEASRNARPTLYNFQQILELFTLFMGVIMLTMFSVTLIRFILPGLGLRYKALDPGDRLAATFHLVFLLSFAAKVIPQGIWTAKLLFGPHFAVQFAEVYLNLWGCSAVNVLLYFSEGVARSVVKVNYFLLGHHLSYVVVVYMMVVIDDPFLAKLGLIIDWFTVASELPLYAALLCHRFMTSTTRVTIITVASLLLSATVRFAEAILLSIFFYGTYNRMAAWGQLFHWYFFLITGFGGGILSVLSSFAIFVRFLVKRHRDPDAYGPARYGLPEQSPQSLALRLGYKV